MTEQDYEVNNKIIEVLTQRLQNTDALPFEQEHLNYLLSKAVLRKVKYEVVMEVLNG